MKSIRFDNPYIKYTLPLFFILLISKILYILGEGYVNHYLIEISLQKSISELELEELKQTVRLLSSTGLLLLFAPLIYFILQRLITQLSHFYFSILAVSFTLFFTFHIFTHHLIEYYVENKKEDYYKAYALSMLRYGIVTDSLSLTKLIDKTNVTDYTIEDKVLLLNLWILTMDKDIKNVESVLEKGRKNIAKQLYNDKSIEDKQTIENHAKYQNDLNLLAKKLQTSWNRYLEGLHKANASQQELLSLANIREKYNSVQEKIERFRQEQYRTYSIAQRFYLDKLEDKSRASNINSLQTQLTKYFDNPTDKATQSSYRSAMNYHFDHYIEPKRWCGTKIVTEYILFLIPYESVEPLCPAHEKIIEVITQEANLLWDQQHKGIAPDIDSFEAYSQNGVVLNKLKRKVNAELEKELSAEITYDNLSLNSFAQHYQIKVEKEIRSSVEQKMKTSFSDYKMPANMTWEQFVQSSFVRDQLRMELIPEYIINDALNIIASKDLVRFNTYFNRDGVEQVELSIDDVLYDLKNMIADEKPMEYGRASYYLIYVIPLFLIFTLFVTVINLISVILMIVAFGLYLNREMIENKKIGHLFPYGIATIDTSIVIFLLLFAFNTPNKTFFNYHQYVYKVYLNTNDHFHKHYFNVLSWVASYEGYSYRIVEKLKKEDEKEKSALMR